MSSSNFLKGFGAGADVMGQLSVDKAIRRKSTASARGFNITNGAAVKGAVPKDTTAAEPAEFAHGLARVPTMALADMTTDSSVVLIRMDARNIYVDGNDGAEFSIWVA